VNVPFKVPAVPLPVTGITSGDAKWGGAAVASCGVNAANVANKTNTPAIAAIFFIDSLLEGSYTNPITALARHSGFLVLS
jgi:hypothetical protein